MNFSAKLMSRSHHPPHSKAPISVVSTDLIDPIVTSDPLILILMIKVVMLSDLMTVIS